MIHWVDMRLTAWGRWVQLGHGRGSAGLSVSWGSIGRCTVPGSAIPVRSIEESRTHDWVKSLPVKDQSILLEVYCTPRTALQHCRILKMSTRTLYARLHDLQAAYSRRDQQAQN